MKKQYLLYLLLENWAICYHIFLEIGAWFIAFEKRAKDISSKLVLFMIIQHCVHRIKVFLTSYSSGNISLFHFQKNFAELSYWFCVAITFLHQPSTLTCRHVLNFAAVSCSEARSTQSYSASRIAQERSGRFAALSSAEASVCFFFVQTGNWGEVKSKREEPGENRNESARGTLGREKERRIVPRAPPIFHFSCFSPPEGASAEERGFAALPF